MDVSMDMRKAAKSVMMMVVQKVVSTVYRSAVQ